MSALYYLDSANILNRGALANDNTGDTLRTAALKINTNFEHTDSALNTIQSLVTGNDSDIISLQSQVTGNDSDIISLQSQVTANDSDIISLQSQVTGNDSDITIINTKLSGIEVGATADQTANEIMSLVQTLDSNGSGLNADTVDGLQASQFLRSDADDTMTGDLTVTGYAKTTAVDLGDTNNVTFDLSANNVAKWNRVTSPVDATNTLTFTGTAGGNLDAMGFTIMAFNGDDDSDRSITFAGDTGITVHYSDSATITWAGPNKYTVISGMVFDSANVLIMSASLVGSV